MRPWLLALILGLAHVPLAHALDQPEGSYRKTCKDARVHGWTLEAQCKRRDGSLALSMINFRKCESPIENNDGRLTCKQSNRRHLPGGSYKDTCRHIRLHRHRLDAECRTRDGEWRETSLKMKNCYGWVTNEDGHLRCDG